MANCNISTTRSDVPLSPDEAQIWTQLCVVSTAGTHPDAVACRLKLAAVTLACRDVMPMPNWQPGKEVGITSLPNCHDRRFPSPPCLISLLLLLFANHLRNSLNSHCMHDVPTVLAVSPEAATRVSSVPSNGGARTVVASTVRCARGP